MDKAGNVKDRFECHKVNYITEKHGEKYNAYTVKAKEARESDALNPQE